MHSLLPKDTLLRTYLHTQLHAFVLYVYIVKYKFALSKAVVGVDRPIKHYLYIYKSRIRDKLFSSNSFYSNYSMHIFNMSTLGRYSIGLNSSNSLKLVGQFLHNQNIYITPI